MSQHPNARLTPCGRELLCSRVAADARVSEAARQAGVSRQTASKWLARARRGEPMSDRPSRPRRLARSTPLETEARVLGARSSMLLAPLALAAATGVPARTCARIVARSGLPRYRQDSCALSDSPIGPPPGAPLPAASRPGSVSIPTRSPRRT